MRRTLAQGNQRLGASAYTSAKKAPAERRARKSVSLSLSLSLREGEAAFSWIQKYVLKPSIVGCFYGGVVEEEKNIEARRLGGGFICEGEARNLTIFGSSRAFSSREAKVFIFCFRCCKKAGICYYITLLARWKDVFYFIFLFLLLENYFIYLKAWMAFPFYEALSNFERGCLLWVESRRLFEFDRKSILTEWNFLQYWSSKLKGICCKILL